MKNDLNNHHSQNPNFQNEPHVDGTFKANQNKNSFADKILAKRISILQRVLPDELTNSILNHQKIILNQHGEKTREIQRIVGEYEVEVMKTALNSVLLKGKGKVALDSKVIFADYRVQLSKELDRLQDEFNEVIDRKFMKLEKIRVPLIKSKIEEEIEIEVETYYEMVAQFIIGYQELSKTLIN